MEIILAKSAGFCFGVDRALKKVYDNLGDKYIYTYGPIIHNNLVVDELKAQGVEVIDSLDALATVPKGEVVIRSHGITEDEHNEILNSGHHIIEATCPYVKRIHKVVAKASANGHHIIIVGNKNHPEVVGIAGWSKESVQFVESLEAVSQLHIDEAVSYEVVAQTTFNHSLYKEIVIALQKLNIHVIINETICKATEDRQIEALEIAKTVDLMIVIGSKHSSNTKKLYEICKRQCENTYHIESIEEFELSTLDRCHIVGITAGASTPKKLIEEVISNVRNAK